MSLLKVLGQKIKLFWGRGNKHFLTGAQQVNTDVLHVQFELFFRKWMHIYDFNKTQKTGRKTKLHTRFLLAVIVRSSSFNTENWQSALTIQENWGFVRKYFKKEPKWENTQKKVEESDESVCRCVCVCAHNLCNHSQVILRKIAGRPGGQGSRLWGNCPFKRLSGPQFGAVMWFQFVIVYDWNNI